MRAIALGVVLAALVAGCLPPAGRLFQTTLTTPDGGTPLPVQLGDQTDLVVGIEPAEVDPSVSQDLSVRADPADPNAIIVSWLGGLCDNDATLAFRPSGPGYELHLEVHGKLGLGCPAAGVFRVIRIGTSEPVPLKTVTVSGTG